MTSAESVGPVTAGRSGATVQEVEYDDAVVRAFVLASVVFGVVGLSVGLLIAVFSKNAGKSSWFNPSLLKGILQPAVDMIGESLRLVTSAEAHCSLPSGQPADRAIPLEPNDFRRHQAGLDESADETEGLNRRIGIQRDPVVGENSDCVCRQ